MIKKIFTNPFVLIFLGVILGVTSKYGDVADAGTLFSYFGYLSSGLVMWLVLCTTMLYLSENRKHAVQLIACFMIPMLISYYFYSYFFTKYLSVKMVVFWMIILIAALVLAYYLWNIRYKKIFRTLYVIASVFAIGYDAIEVNGFLFSIMIAEIIMALMVLLCINKVIERKQAVLV